MQKQSAEYIVKIQKYVQVNNNNNNINTNLYNKPKTDNPIEVGHNYYYIKSCRYRLQTTISNSKQNETFNIKENKINKNNINVQNNGHISTNNIHSIVQTDKQIYCSPYSTHSRDTKNIKSIPSTIPNLTAVNSEIKSQSNLYFFFRPILQ